MFVFLTKNSIYFSSLNDLKPEKGQSQSTSTRQNVQVFTSLPPKVQGEIKCFLRLQISRINWLKGDTKKQQQQQGESSILARCVWWGEESSRGALFRPRLVYPNQPQTPQPNTSSSLQTIARYMIRSGPKQFNAYLNGSLTFLF